MIFEQEQHLPDGTPVLRWQLHWVAGWDPKTREYRASIADNSGEMALYRGWIDGDVLTFEPIDRTPPMIRLTWDFRDAAHPAWRNEGSLDGERWFLIEAYQLVIE